MYDELYEAWKSETSKTELQKLPSDYYGKLSEYVKRIREEMRMLDPRTVKAKLIREEYQHARMMIRDLIQIRYRKLTSSAVRGAELPSDFLTEEEQALCKDVSAVAEAFREFAQSLIRGQRPAIILDKSPKRIVLRFLKDVPAIIGSDMKPYGPFKPEDIASLPTENAKILSRQGLAEKVEIPSN
jgi:DNA replication factor GINS